MSRERRKDVDPNTGTAVVGALISLLTGFLFLVFTIGMLMAII